MSRDRAIALQPEQEGETPSPKKKRKTSQWPCCKLVIGEIMEVLLGSCDRVWIRKILSQLLVMKSLKSRECTV